MRKIVISQLSAEQIEEDKKVLIVNQARVPLAWISLSDGWWKYDVEPVGTGRRQPCESIKECKEWVRLNRGRK